VSILALPASASAASSITYTPGTPTVDTITDGASAAPWNTSQGDSGTTTSPNTPYPSSDLLPTYTPGGSTVAGSPNVAVYPGATSGTDGNSPYPSGTVGTPGPLDGYCGTGSQTVEGANSTSADAVVRQPAGTTLPFAPYYFPHIVRNSDGSLTGYFDYRPKDADEAVVAASSIDNGKTWTYDSEALEQNPELCPSADVNDDGEGHANVLTVGGTTDLYTLPRAAGDNVGVGMLVHTLTPTESNPLAGAPATEPTGLDPDDFALAGVTVPFTGGTAQTITFATPVGTGPEALVPGEFVDLTQTPKPTTASVITCTGVGTSSLTGCTTTASAGIIVKPGDLIEQVIGTVADASDTVPAGPNTTNGDGGFGTIDVNFASQTTATIINNNAPNRVYIDGVAVYCAQSNANPTTAIENCTTGGGNSALTVVSGDPITMDPIVPATATAQTSGLIAPDGIVGVLPSYPTTGTVPAGATYVMYTEKVLGYYVAGTTTNTGSVKFSTGTVTFTPSASDTGTSTGPVPSDMPVPSAVSAATPVTIYLGDTTKSIIVADVCTSLSDGASTDTLSGCTLAPAYSGDSGDSFNKTSMVGAPGAATVSDTTLQLTGEGVSQPASTKNIAKLFKNNEDLTVLRVAYTTDGINFSDANLANAGIISGASGGASSYSDINNPSSTTSPSNLNAYATPGTTDATEMRFVGSAGTIITNSDGSYGLFLSGAWAGDGDSDAFNQVFYATSTDGEHWSVPTSVVSTDYTFSASEAQDAAEASGSDTPLGVSAYYSGRAYGPSVVPNYDNSGNVTSLTMVFAGYRIPKTIANVGTALGTGSPQYVIGANDPALYRNILTVTLTPSGVGTSPAASTPQSPAVVLLPIVGLATIGGVYLVIRRRRPSLR
jgi:hypothetical protein